MRLDVWLDQVTIKQTSFLAGVDFRFEFEIDTINSWVGVALFEQSLFILFWLCLALFRVEVKFKNFLETKLYRLSILVFGPFLGLLCYSRESESSLKSFSFKLSALVLEV